MTAYLIAENIADLEVGLGFLKISKLIKDSGEFRTARGVHVITVRLAKPYNQVAELVSARFGRFVQLRKP